jgi:ribonuclease E
VARQLRLRDLGGLIVIDLIDMREMKHNNEVEKVLKQALKMDKARVNLGRISEFGILEMSRQRIAKTLNDAIHLSCPHCEGRGKVKSVEAMALSFLRKVHGAAAKGTVAEVHGGLPLEVAYYLLNRKKRELTQIENDYDIEVTVKGKTSYLLNQMELEVVKREKSHAEDVQKSEADAEEAHKPAPTKEMVSITEVNTDQLSEGGESTEGGKKRKRRRKKKKHAGELTPPEANVESIEAKEHPHSEEQSELPVADTAEKVAESDHAETEGTAKQKKRRRRRGRKVPKGQEVTSLTADETVVEVVPAEPVEMILPDEKPKRPRASRAKKKPGVDASAELQKPVAPPEKVEGETPVVQKPPRRAAPKKSEKSDVLQTEPVTEKLKPAPLAGRKKKDAKIE